LVESIDEDGRPTRYHYDALGRRIRKQSDSAVTHFFWNGDALVGEARCRLAPEGTPAAAQFREWVHHPGSFRPLLVVENTLEGAAEPARDAVHVFHSDPNGCPTRLVDVEGNIVWTAQHDAWGQAHVRADSAIDNPIRLQGQYADDETGLYYTRHRYYDPSVGQFISQDPLSLAAGNNLYRFAPNVFRWIDPHGLVPDKGAMPSDFYDNMYRQVAPSDLAPAPDFIHPVTGDVLTAHPNAHSVPKATQADVVNNWEHYFTGVNYNGRPVDAFWKDEMVVITAAGHKTQVITAYGKGIKGSGPVKLSRWRPEGWKPGERFTRWARNKLRPCK
jgi:RHS repeat-associated protein